MQILDKSVWPVGPWQSEPDTVYFCYAGYSCYILRIAKMGHLCGYVALPAEEFELIDIDSIQVHGGITAAGDGSDYTLTAARVIGFDCAHSGDHIPILGMPQSKNTVYRTIEFVTQELHSLVKQIKAQLAAVREMTKTLQIGINCQSDSEILGSRAVFDDNRLEEIRAAYLFGAKRSAYPGQATDDIRHLLAVIDDLSGRLSDSCHARQEPPSDLVEQVAKAYADATEYYVTFHRGLRSPSADRIRAGARAVLALLQPRLNAADALVQAAEQVVSWAGAEVYSDDSAAKLAADLQHLHDSAISAKAVGLGGGG